MMNPKRKRTFDQQENNDEAVKPFRVSNAEHLKFIHYQEKEKKEEEVLSQPSHPPELTFPPLLNGDEPSFLTELRKKLFLNALDSLDHASLHTQLETCQETFGKVMEFIDQAWTEERISSRCIDTLPTALIFTNGLDPWFVFHSFQRQLESKDYYSLLLTSASVNHLTSMVKPILKMYASTSDTEEVKENVENEEGEEVEEEEEDIDALPRNQSPVFLLLIPSFESFPSTLFSHFILMLPKGFRIVFVLGLSTHSHFLSTELISKAYRRLYIQVFPLWSMKQTLDHFFLTFLKDLYEKKRIYLQWDAQVMDWFLTSYRQVHGTFAPWTSSFKYALLDYFYATPLSVLCHPDACEARETVDAKEPIQGVWSGLDPVLLNALPSVMHWATVQSEGPLADPTYVHAWLRQKATWKVQYQRWLQRLDLQWMARFLAIQFLHRGQWILDMDQPKSFAYLYQLASEETLLNEGFIQAFLSTLKNIAEGAATALTLNDSKQTSRKKKQLSLLTDVHQLVLIYQQLLNLLQPYAKLFPSEWEQIQADADYFETFVVPPDETQLYPDSLIKSSEPSHTKDCHPRQCIDRLWAILEQWTAPISNFPCYEIYVYRRVHVLEQTFQPNPPKTLHYVLSHPNKYLSSSHIPDLTLLHRLYMESGKTISLLDFYEAFKVLISSTHSPSHLHTNLDIELEYQLRFLRGMGELEYLGFIQKKRAPVKGKTTDRVDQTVMKLTWG
ncbi:Origin recognition complex subunit 3 [Coelomomyces lativittatus]|nr:Origin recognition complex subunit 3 [Coelomomyces lativittatus]KAJ1513158.1 Origin recognition complex subunit 3 [Coelomomyces lativittatus]